MVSFQANLWSYDVYILDRKYDFLSAIIFFIFSEGHAKPCPYLSCIVQHTPNSAFLTPYCPITLTRSANGKKTDATIEPMMIAISPMSIGSISETADVIFCISCSL